jgi:hypothetical protein
MCQGNAHVRRPANQYCTLGNVDLLGHRDSVLALGCLFRKQRTQTSKQQPKLSPPTIPSLRQSSNKSRRKPATCAWIVSLLRQPTGRWKVHLAQKRGGHSLNALTLHDANHTNLAMQHPRHGSMTTEAVWINRPKSACRNCDVIPKQAWCRATLDIHPSSGAPCRGM